MLAAIYSSTLPLLQRVAAQPAAASTPGLSPSRMGRLQHSLESVVFHLLRSAYCTRQGALASGGPDAVAAQAAAAGGASSSSSSRQPPPGFSRGVAGVGFSAEIQGQELMNLLMLLAHPSDIDGVPAADHSKGNLLAAVNHTHQLDVAVSSAASEVSKSSRHRVQEASILVLVSAVSWFAAAAALRCHCSVAVNPVQCLTAAWCLYAHPCGSCMLVESIHAVRWHTVSNRCLPASASSSNMLSPIT